jgi:twinkle protein|tara:strand:- start:6746 stop:8218 length:1473 start_codon:yes stop_codon:yes gene_type:complete
MDFVEGEATSLSARGISLETCRKWDYCIGEVAGQPVQIANYKDASGTRVAQKIRFRNKDFHTKGDIKVAGLYGQHLWSGKGKKAIICEGEIDALSVSQSQGNRWPVYSVPNGAAGAPKAIRSSIELLDGYDEVIFCFDSDDAGTKAARECAQVLPPGKAKIAKLPLKDANEMLVKGRVKELVDCIWQARIYRPDGIVNGKDLWDIVSAEDSMSSCDYPYEGINKKTLGMRRGEIVTITAGAGIGKSQVCREIANHVLNQEQKIGYIALEESNKRTGLGFMGLHLNKPLHLGTVEVTDEEFKDAFDSTLNTGNIYMYDHWGSLASDNLLSKIRYMVTACECSFIILDHLSIVVSGIEEGDERRTIDNLMTKLRGLVEEVNCGLILVSHLKRPQGNKGHEDGAQTSMAQLRGSASIGQLSDIVIGCERDQQGDNPDRTTVRVLKNRWTGETGIACELDYDHKTGRLTEVPLDEIPFDESDEEASWSGDSAVF